MIRISTMAGRKVAVFGLGASGTSTVRALQAGGAEVLAWDDGEASRASAIKSGISLVDLAAADWTGLAALVLAPGVPLTHPEPHWTVKKAKVAGVEVIGDIELYFRERAAHAADAPVIAVTGTNGKSTTTALITHVLRTTGHEAEMGGNIGRPALDLSPPAPARFHVIEMSTFQIDLTPSLAPSVGVLLNLSPDHLDRHGPADDPDLAMRNYAAIKERLVRASARAVVGIDDELCRRIADRLSAGSTTTVSIRGRAPGRLHQAFGAGSTLLSATGDEPEIVDGDISGIGTLRGAHNLQNALAALSAVSIARPGDPRAAFVGAMRTYPGLPHRMEQVGRAGEVLFINDSKATNADSTEKALASFPADIYWILGGKPKEGGITALAQYFPRIAKAYLIGQASDAFAETLQGRVPYERSGKLDAALAHATRDALASGRAEPIVLLSPACASYDQFKSFEHRGDVFRRLVQEFLAATSVGAAAPDRKA